MQGFARQPLIDSIELQLSMVGSRANACCNGVQMTPDMLDGCSLSQLFLGFCHLAGRSNTKQLIGREQSTRVFLAF